MLSRKDAILATAMIANANYSAPARAADELGVVSTPKALAIRSPKDAFITEIKARTGSVVAAGDELLSVDHSAEDRTLDRISLALDLADIELNVISDPNLSNQQAALNLAVDIANAYQQSLKAQLDETQAQVKAGALPPINVLVAEVSLARAVVEGKRASLALTNFKFNVDQATKRHKALTERLTAEKQSVQDQIDRLTLKAPVSGTATLVVAVGMFVKKGSLVAEIVPA